ncbi:hypothetical protein EWM64_g6958, partial [Hericium alpestre]
REAFWFNSVRPRVILTEGISPRDKTAAAHARQVLDDELSAMHLAICSLRTRRNALSLISCLPAEILVRVFQFYAALQLPASDKQHRLGWINATHVCRLWRDTALQCPTLWTDVCFALGPQWAEEMLCRTKTMPISLRSSVAGTSLGLSSLNLISKHLHRARDILLIASPSFLKLILPHLPSPSSILETMMLGPFYDAQLLQIDTNFELPGIIAGCRFPRLRHLSLRGCWVHWSAPILCGLTYLEIQLNRAHMDAADGYLKSSPKKLFCALKSMPALEILILTDCFPSGPWIDGGSDILQLPRMKLLRLHGPSAACFGVARWLRLPARCKVQIRCSDGADLAGLLQFLHAHVGAGINLPPWHTLQIVPNLPSGFRVEMWRPYHAFEERPKADNADLLIWFHDVEQSLRPLKVLCQVLPLETIRIVCVIVGTHDLSLSDWIGILGRCTEIQQAVVGGDHALSFCKALSMTTDCRPVASLRNCVQERLFLGKLKVLRVVDVPFPSRFVEVEPHSPRRQLVQWLTERQHVEAVPRLTIQLCRCGIKEEWVEALREVVVVEWDGIEGSMERRPALEVYEVW